MSVTLYVFTVNRSGSAITRHPWAVVGLEPETRYVGLRLKNLEGAVLARRFDHALSGAEHANDIGRECLGLKGLLNVPVDVSTPHLRQFFEHIGEAFDVSDSQAILRNQVTESIGAGPVDALLETLTDGEFARWRTVVEERRWT